MAIVLMAVFYALGIFFDVAYLKTSNQDFHRYYIICCIIAWFLTLCSIIIQIRKHKEQKSKLDNNISSNL